MTDIVVVFFFFLRECYAACVASEAQHFPLPEICYRDYERDGIFTPGNRVSKSFRTFLAD